MEMIINADDFGMNQNVNKAIEYCFEKKLIQRTSLMVNMSDTDYAVNTSKDKGFYDKVGLHINLVQGKPITERIRETDLCDKDGFFNGSLMCGSNRFCVNKYTKKAIEEEIEAQIKKYLAYGFTLKNVDSHMHSHTNFSILKIVIALMEKYGLVNLRLSRNIPTNSINGIKFFYKDYVNRKIINFNYAYSKKIVNYFGSMQDFDNETIDFKKSNCIVEIMVHPVMIDGQIADAVSDYNVIEWMSNCSKLYYKE